MGWAGSSFRALARDAQAIGGFLNEHGRCKAVAPVTMTLAGPPRVAILAGFEVLGVTDKDRAECRPLGAHRSRWRDRPPGRALFCAPLEVLGALQDLPDRCDEQVFPALAVLRVGLEVVVLLGEGLPRVQLG